MAVDSSQINTEPRHSFDDSTICCICTEVYKCPKLLLCGHTFCLNCIQETGLKASKGPGDEMPCPFCRRQFKIPSDGFTGLKNNYYAEGLIRVTQLLKPSDALFTVCDACSEDNQDAASKEVPKAEMYCWDCKQKLCEECCRHHRKLKLTKNHKLISINELQSTDEDLLQSLVSIVCEFHKEEDLKIYCCVCKTVACSICFTENHEGHKGTHVTKAVDDFRKEIVNNIEKVLACISQAEMKKSEIIKAKQDVQVKLKLLEDGIISRRDHLKQVVDEHATKLLKELSSKMHSISKEIQIETDNIDAQLETLKTCNSSCKKIMTKGSACDICRSVGDLSARVNELQNENQPLIEKKLKPVNLYFTETEVEKKYGDNMIGQLKDYVKVEDEMQDDRTEADDYVPYINRNCVKLTNTNVDNLKTEKENKYLRGNEGDKTLEIPKMSSFWNSGKFIGMFSDSQLKTTSFKIVTDDSESLVLYALNSMTIKVNRESIATIHDVDAVVSCINHRLDLDGSFADQIIKAAGPSVEKELASHKKKLVFLQTGNCVSTSAGNLSGFKVTIHVVGPQERVNDQKMSRNALRRVFTTCLCYVNDELKLRSICLPPIGLALYGAQMVIDCFFDAIEMFAKCSAVTEHQPAQHVDYIQLVSNDPNCVRQLIQCTRRRLSSK